MFILSVVAAVGHRNRGVHPFGATQQMGVNVAMNAVTLRVI